MMRYRTNPQTAYANIRRRRRMSTDVDYLAYVARSGATDPAQLAATLTLVNAGKAHGWWNIMDAVWPMLGTTGTTQSKNLIRDFYNLTYIATPTFVAKGMQFNGTTTYAVTGFTPSSAIAPKFTQNNSSFGAWNTAGINWNAGSPGSCPIGCVGGGVYSTMRQFPATNVQGGNNDVFANLNMAVTAGNELGVWGCIRTSSAGYALAQKAQYSAGASVSTGLPTLPFWIGAENNAGLWAQCAYTCGLAWIGAGMSQALWDVFRADGNAFIASAHP